MESSMLLKLLAEDRYVISYRPSFARLTGDPLAAILLQQIIIHWEQKGQRPFYKFRQPCNHSLYKPRDSWTEELEWGVKMVDTALRHIATKIKRGESKTELRNTDVPQRREGESDAEFLGRLQAAVRRLVLYWTDSNRVTWYEVNGELLAKFLSGIYLDNSCNINYLKNAVAGDILKRRVEEKSSNTPNQEVHESETPTETPTETPKEKDSAPVGATMPQSLWTALVIERALPYFILAAKIEANQRKSVEEKLSSVIGPNRTTYSSPSALERDEAGPPYQCTNKDINEMIAAWYEWVPKRPTKRGKIIPEADHYKIPANRDYARNLYERGARPGDLIVLLNEIHYAEEGTKWAYYRDKELTFCYVCQLLEEWLPGYREDWWYTDEMPRVLGRRKGLQMRHEDFYALPGRVLLERYANHPDFIVDVPPVYVSAHELEDDDEDIPHVPVTAEQIKELAERGEL